MEARQRKQSEADPLEPSMPTSDSTAAFAHVHEVPAMKEMLKSKLRLSLLTETKGNYQGFINVAIMLLVLANFRLMVTNMQKYGILLNLATLFGYDPTYSDMMLLALCTVLACFCPHHAVFLTSLLLISIAHSLVWALLCGLFDREGNFLQVPGQVPSVPACGQYHC
jgi:hypothetical protein